MSENSRLKIHTNTRPTEPMTAAASDAAQQSSAPIEREQNVSPQPSAEETERMRAQVQRARRRNRSRRSREEQPLTAGEKLLRNTAAACALLLTAMAIKNVDQPWSRQAAEGIRQAMTMRVDWDETLGKLSFVRAIVPDTALVFLNMGEERDLIRPVKGEVSHAFTEQQPWIEYRCEAGEAVCAAADGMVTAAGQGAGGDWIVLIECADGTQTVYGYLAEVYVKAGDAAEKGQQIGATADKADSRLYFELRGQDGSIDPEPRMK